MRQGPHLLPLLAVLLLAAPAAPAQVSQALNPPSLPTSGPAISGSVDASHGAYASSVPIELPPGRQGVEPSIALSYSSAAPNDIAGQGWSLSGLPGITRMRRAGRGIRYDGHDTYALAGGWGREPDARSSLVWLPGRQRYRLEHDNLMELEPGFGPGGAPCGDGPCYWLARDGRGNRLYFGGDESSHAGAAGSAANEQAVIWERDNGVEAQRGILFWALFKVADADDNHYLVQYHNDGDSLRPQIIRYALPGTPSAHFVRFVYEPRPDTTARTRFSVRLRQIEVGAGGQPSVNGDEPQPETPPFLPDEPNGTPGFGLDTVSDPYNTGGAPGSTGWSPSGSGGSSGDVCRSERLVPGCAELPACERAVCKLDSFCCFGQWDRHCAECANGRPGYGGVSCTSVGGACAPALPTVSATPVTFTVTPSATASTAIPETIVRSYVLHYQSPPPVSGRSLLSSVQQSGGTESLPPRTFTYTEGGGAPETLERVDASWVQLTDAWGLDTDATWQTHVGDFNGDGRDDVVRCGTVPTSTSLVAIESAYGALDQRGPVVHFSRTHSRAGNSGPHHQRCVVGDVDRDGFDDLVVLREADYGQTLEVGVEHGYTQGRRLPRDVQRMTWGDSLSSASVYAADVNGDEHADVVLVTPQTQRLLFMLGSDGGLGELTWAGNIPHAQAPEIGFGAPGSWERCTPPPSARPMEIEVLAGVLPVDVDGDGYDDIVSAFYRPEIPHSALERRRGTPAPGRGLVRLAYAMGTSVGLNGVAESCFDTHEGLGGSFVRWPWLALRAGDVNGDGAGDLLLSYQGQRTLPADPGDPLRGASRGMRYGRDVRALFGHDWSGSGGPDLEPLSQDASQSFAHSSYDTRQGTPHLAQWEILSGDVDGDGIHDQVQVYRGQMGRFLFTAMGSPDGSLGPWQAHPTNTSARQPDGPHNHYPKHHATLADVNGDGHSDLVVILHGGGVRTRAEVLLGGASGFAAQPTPIAASARGVGAAAEIRLDVADFNGDGKDDVLVVNERGRALGARGTDPAQPELFFMMSRDTAAPDLLETDSNGFGGRTTVEYASAVDHPGAVDVFATSCVGAQGPGSHDECGLPDTQPRHLATRITLRADAGQPSNFPGTATLYRYHNGRRVAGALEARRSLGFEHAEVEQEETRALSETFFRMDPPFDGLVHERLAYAGHGQGCGDCALRENRLLSRSTSAYGAVAGPHGNLRLLVQASTRETFDFGHPVHSATTGYIHDRFGNPTQVIDDAGGDVLVGITEYRNLDAPDTWLIGRVEHRRTMQYDTLLDWRRYLYQDAAGHPTRLREVQRVLFRDASAASCATYASFCSAEVAAGLARWVTTMQGFVYDGRGRLSEMQDGLGRVHAVGYDPTFGAWTASATGPMGRTSTRDFDLAGRVTSATDINGHQTTLELDGPGRPERATLPAAIPLSGGNLEWSYASLGATSIDQQRAETRLTVNDQGHEAFFSEAFDGLGRANHRITRGHGSCEVRVINEGLYRDGLYVARSSTPACYQGWSPRTRRYWIEHTTDAAGRPARIERRFDNGALQSLVAEIDYEGATSHLTDAKGRTSSRSVDARGRLVSITDAAGQQTSFVHDGAGRVILVQLPGRGAATCPSSACDTVTVEYDTWGRVRSRTEWATGTTTFEWDDAGRLAASVDQRGVRTEYSFDELDRPQTVSSPSDSVTFVYDDPNVPNGVGRLSAVINGAGIVRYDAYDERGNLLSKTYHPNGVVGSFTHEYVYDHANRLVLHRFPDATEEGFEYDALGHLLEVHLDGELLARYSDFLGTGQPQRKELFDTVRGRLAAVTSFRYDDDFRLYTLQTTNTTGAVLQSYRYSYDAVGNVTRIEDLRPKRSRTVGGVNTDESQAFGYDDLDRLMSAWSPTEGKRIYRFDSLGNLTVKADTSLFYSDCDGGRCVKGVGKGAGFVATHDLAGRRTSFADDASGRTFRYGYDDGNRLRRVHQDGRLVATMDYLASGVRLRKTVVHADRTRTTTWSLGDGFELREHSSRRGIFSVTKRISGPGGTLAVITDGPSIARQPTAREVTRAAGTRMSGDTSHGVPQGMRLILPNHLGSASVITDERGSVLARYVHRPYGSVVERASVGLDQVTRSFTGKERDADTGLIDFGARHYDPISGRFLTADPMIPHGGLDPQGYNRFAYVLGNPIRYVDPTGHADQPKNGEVTGKDVFDYVKTVLENVDGDAVKAKNIIGVALATVQIMAKAEGNRFVDEWIDVAGKLETVVNIAKSGGMATGALVNLTITANYEAWKAIILLQRTMAKERTHDMLRGDLSARVNTPLARHKERCEAGHGQSCRNYVAAGGKADELNMAAYRKEAIRGSKRPRFRKTRLVPSSGTPARPRPQQVDDVPEPEEPATELLSLHQVQPTSQELGDHAELPEELNGSPPPGPPKIYEGAAGGRSGVPDHWLTGKVGTLDPTIKSFATWKDVPPDARP